MTRNDIKLASDLIASSLYRAGHRDPGALTTVQLNNHFADACPRLSQLASDWHWNRIVASVKRKLAELAYYDQLEASSSRRRGWNEVLADVAAGYTSEIGEE